jgi:hypothetical protein
MVKRGPSEIQYVFGTLIRTYRAGSYSGDHGMLIVVASSPGVSKDPNAIQGSWIGRRRICSYMCTNGRMQRFGTKEPQKVMALCPLHSN